MLRLSLLPFRFFLIRFVFCFPFLFFFNFLVKFLSFSRSTISPSSLEVSLSSLLRDFDFSGFDEELSLLEFSLRFRFLASGDSIIFVKDCWNLFMDFFGGSLELDEEMDSDIDDEFRYLRR